MRLCGSGGSLKKIGKNGKCTGVSNWLSIVSCDTSEKFNVTCPLYRRTVIHRASQISVMQWRVQVILGVVVIMSEPLLQKFPGRASYLIETMRLNKAKNERGLSKILAVSINQPETEHKVCTFTILVTLR